MASPFDPNDKPWPGTGPGQFLNGAGIALDDAGKSVEVDVTERSVAATDAIVQRLSAALARALADEKVKSIIRTLGNDTGAGTPDDLAAQVRWDVSNFRRIIDERHLTFPE